jgi:hypothetical protein
MLRRVVALFVGEAIHKQPLVKLTATRALAIMEILSQQTLPLPSVIPLPFVRQAKLWRTRRSLRLRQQVPFTLKVLLLELVTVLHNRTSGRQLPQQ